MIYPVILCGGSGTRLWPLSRKSYPKQFSRIVGDQTLFQKTCTRFQSDGFAAPTIVTNDAFRFTVLDELSELNLSARKVILEPSPKNTAPAILAAVLDVVAVDEDATILVLPADHAIADVEAFLNAIHLANAEMKQDQLVTFGILPDQPETGYGYLELADKSAQINTLQKLSRFVEKPNKDAAQTMIEAGNFLWNGGIFMSSAKNFMENYRQLETGMVEAVDAAVKTASSDGYFMRPQEASWNKSPDISFDYAIMEKAENLAVVPVDMGWNDLGDWRAVWQVSPKDDKGVSLVGSAYSIDCQDSMLRSEKEEMVVVGIGLKDVFAVAMNDAVVVGAMDRAQEVKDAVALLKADELKQATEFPRDDRPWGWYETLALGDRFQVKRIVVKPGAALSLQSHVHRSEHWTVVEGTARVTVDEEIKLLRENQSVYIPLGAIHRMENPGKIPLTLIEVQSGPYLGEDDIIRYEDQFGRS